MRFFKRGVVLTLTVWLLSCLSACGSSDGSQGASIEVVEPRSELTLSPGDIIEYQVRTVNFTLANPFTDRMLDFRHEGHDHGDEQDQDSNNSLETPPTPTPSLSAGMDHSPTQTEVSDHDHSSLETNPHAVEGHYHIYLDDAAGSETHTTAWTEHGEYQLPLDIAPGTHSLRFELRDNNHILVGTTHSEAVLFFEVQ